VLGLRSEAPADSKPVERKKNDKFSESNSSIDEMTNIEKSYNCLATDCRNSRRAGPILASLTWCCASSASSLSLSLSKNEGGVLVITTHHRGKYPPAALVRWDLPPCNKPDVKWRQCWYHQ
jgi:hypothetical protein